MFRRKSVGWQTKQMSFQVSLTLSINGQANMAHGAVVMGYDSLLSQGAPANAAPIWKGIQIKHFDYGSDVALMQVSNSTLPGEILSGAECWYVDSVAPTTGLGRLEAAAGANATAFLSFNEIGQAQDTTMMPRRIVYRRRFTLQQVNGAGASLGNSQLASAAGQTPGFGTNRQVKRFIKLGRTEALFYHWEIYNVRTTAASNIIAIADVLGAITYRAVA